MSLDLAAIVQSALAAVPGTMRRTVTFRRIVPGTVDGATDTRTTTTTLTFAASVVVTTPKATDGQPVSDDERVLLLAARDTTWKPAPGHSARNVLADDASTWWRVTAVKTLDPNGVSAFYEVTVRR